MLACCRLPGSLAGKASKAEEAATVAVAAAVRVAVVADTRSTQRERLWCSQERTMVIGWLSLIGRAF